MIKKNPKKNYSLKGKPLSTKIAFVVICAFVFSLFVGSFGGLLYLGRSCASSNFTVAADGVGGNVNQTYEGYVTLDVSTIQYNIEFPTNNDHSQFSGNDFQLYFPFEILNNEYSNWPGYISELIFRTRSFISDSNWRYNEVDLFSMELGDVVSVDTGCMDLYFFETCNIAMSIEYSDTNLPDYATFFRVSYCEWSFMPGFNNDALTLFIYDTNGFYKYFEIYPSIFRDNYYLNPLTNFSAIFVYKVLNFDAGSIDNAYDNGFKAGLELGSADVAEAYSRGKEDGKTEGIAIGRQQGIEEAEDYNFFTLLDAVFYAPIKAFISIFNFEFMGVNILGVVTSLVTIVIAFGVLKFFL